MAMGFTGFAFPLIAAGALALYFPATEFVPALSIVADICLVLLLLENLGGLRGGTFGSPLFRPPVLAVVGVGLVGGRLLLTGLPILVARVLLGASIVGFALESLRSRPTRRLEAAGSQVPTLSPRTFALGFMAGIFQGWMGIGGPLVVLIALKSALTRKEMLASFALFFLLTDVFRIAEFVASGLLTASVGALAAQVSIVTAVGYPSGIALRRLLRDDVAFRHAVRAILIGTGTWLMVDSAVKGFR